MTKQSTGTQFEQHRDYSMGKIDAIANIVSSAFAILGRRLLGIV